MRIEVQTKALATNANDFATDLNYNMLAFFDFIFYVKMFW
jgi:hypothetical protein